MPPRVNIAVLLFFVDKSDRGGMNGRMLFFSEAVRYQCLILLECMFLLPGNNRRLQYLFQLHTGCFAGRVNAYALDLFFINQYAVVVIKITIFFWGV